MLGYGLIIIEAMLVDEYFLDVHNDDIKFNISYDMGFICFMTYEEVGNTYILEVVNTLNQN